MTDILTALAAVFSIMLQATLTVILIATVIVLGLLTRVDNHLRRNKRHHQH